MMISIAKADLLNALTHTLPAVSPKSNLPILEGVLLKTDEDLFILSAYDMNLGIESRVEQCEILRRGAVVLPGRIFFDIVRKLPDMMVTIDVSDSLSTTITCHNTVYDIMGLSPMDFPEMPQIDGENSIEISQASLKTMISSTLFSVSTDESKPVQTGSLFEVSGALLRIVSVCSASLALYQNDIVNKSEKGEYSFVVPQRILKELERMLSEGDEMVQITTSKKHVVFSMAETVINSRLLEGEFFNYRGVLPKSGATMLSIEPKSMQEAVERVSIVSSDRIKTPVRIQFDENIMKLYCNSIQNNSYDECPMDGDGGGVEIGFNHRILQEILKSLSISGEEAQMGILGPLSPCHFVPMEGDAFFYLIVPIRLTQ